MTPRTQDPTYLHQCPGCWGYGVFAKPMSKSKGEGWIECECGERMTRIDLRDPAEATLDPLRLAAALDNVDREPQPTSSKGRVGSEPRTEAGRSYFRDSLRGDPSKWADTPEKLRERIVAIEQEAARPLPEPQPDSQSVDHPWAGDEDGHNCATCIERDDHFNKCDRLAHAMADVLKDAAAHANEQMAKNLRETGSIAGPGFHPSRLGALPDRPEPHRHVEVDIAESVLKEGWALPDRPEPSLNDRSEVEGPLGAAVDRMADPLAPALGVRSQPPDPAETDS